MVPFVIAFLWVKLLKKRTWMIIGIEVFIVLLLTWIGIIENYPTGNMQSQLSSYFGDITNNFYLKYIPFIIMTIILIQMLNKQNNQK
jgi:amino acid transporter